MAAVRAYTGLQRRGVWAAGFLNPAIRMIWGHGMQLTDPDPKRRLWNTGVKLPWLAVLGATAALLNYLLIRARYRDEDDLKDILDQMRQRPDENRMAFMAIGGRMRLPFDWGLPGAWQSYGWNSMEQWLLEDDIAGEKRVAEALRRIRRMPWPMDFINPQLKTAWELYLNHSFFYDDDIVPYWMEANFPYNPELQTWDDMPEVYNKIGRGLRVSPIKVRYAVQNILTRQMDDTIRAVEHIARKKPYAEGADLPFIGSLIDRKSIGWQSQSVRSLAELDKQYQALNTLANSIQQREGRTEDYRTVKRQLRQLEPARNAMRHIQGIWNRIKEESAKPQPDREKTQRMKRDMTRRARVFLGRYERQKAE